MDPEEFTVLTIAPEQAALNAPEGLIETPRPEFQWDLADRATWYRLWVGKNTSDTSSPGVIDEWIDRTNSYTHGSDLPPGNYKWQIRTWGGPHGFGPWSESLEFVYGVPTLLSPTGDEGDTTPEFEWTRVDGISWYKVVVKKNGVPVDEKWVEGVTHTFLDPLAIGDYKWWVWVKPGGIWSKSKVEEFSITDL